MKFKIQQGLNIKIMNFNILVISIFYQKYKNGGKFTRQTK